MRYIRQNNDIKVVTLGNELLLVKSNLDSGVARWSSAFQHVLMFTKKKKDVPDSFVSLHIGITCGCKLSCAYTFYPCLPQRIRPSLGSSNKIYPCLDGHPECKRPLASKVRTTKYLNLLLKVLSLSLPKLLP